MSRLSLGRAFEFMRLMLKLQGVQRFCRPPGREAYENDAEHSYQLAMMAWYINESCELGYDTALLLHYALAHDLVEVYAGDVAILDHAARAGKAEREAAALERIAGEFAEFGGLVELIRQYERLEDREARFVKALDKVMPMMLTYLERGGVWRERGLSRKELLDNKDQTTGIDPDVGELWRALRVVIEAEPGLFARD
jgi:putative hydrolase of HD superfamily